MFTTGCEVRLRLLGLIISGHTPYNLIPVSVRTDSEEF